MYLYEAAFENLITITEGLIRLKSIPRLTSCQQPLIVVDDGIFEYEMDAKGNETIWMFWYQYFIWKQLDA